MNTISNSFVIQDIFTKGRYDKDAENSSMPVLVKINCGF